MSVFLRFRAPAFASAALCHQMPQIINTSCPLDPASANSPLGILEGSGNNFGSVMGLF
jgi:hypothetical protein